MVRSSGSASQATSSIRSKRRRRQQRISPHKSPPGTSHLNSDTDGGSPATRAEMDIDEAPRPSLRRASQGLVPGREGREEMPPFVRGNLVRVRMKNFLTYSDTTIRPGPRMNVIVGPNGSGKSSIVNAVCLVFGGPLRLLGRSTDLTAYIKHGEQEAQIEADIYDPNYPRGIRTVKRVFDVEKRGHFEVDGERVGMSELHAQVTQEYDIQLDNLSQFMPQEKIADFLSLRSSDLLNTTIRSLGGDEKEKLYSELIALDRSVLNGNQGLRQREELLKELKQQHEADREEVNAYLAQQEEKRKLKLLKKYMTVIEAREAKDFYIESLKERKDVEEAVQSLKDSVQNVERGEINRLRQNLDSVTNSFRASREASRHAEQRVIKALDRSDNLSMTLASVTRDLNDVENTTVRRKRDIQKAEEHLASLEREFEEAKRNSNPEQEERRLDELRDQRNRITSETGIEQGKRPSLERKLQNASRQIRHNEHKLRNQGDVRAERIRLLSQDHTKRRLPDFDKFVKGLRAQNRFRLRVFGPVGAEIEVDNEYHARIMESCVKGFLRTAFVTECSSDATLLINECKKQFGASPDVITVPTNRNDEPDVGAIQSQVPIRPVDDELRSYGIEAVVCDIYRAPDAVRAALNAQASLHLIHVGTEQSTQCIDNLRMARGIKAWYNPTARCQILTSRYDPSARNLTQDTSFMSVQGRLFNGSMQDAIHERERLKTLIREAEEERTQASEQIRDMEGRVLGLHNALRETDKEIREILEQQRERKGGAAKIQRARERVEERRRKAASDSASTNKRKFEAEKKRLQQEQLKNIPEMKDMVQALVKNLRKLDELSTERLVAQRRLTNEEAKYSQVEDEIREKSKLIEVLKKQSRSAKSVWKEKLHIAKRSITEEEIQENEALFQHPAVSNGIESLKDEIARRSGQIDGLLTGGRAVLDNYEFRQGKIDKLTSEVEKMRSEHAEKLGSFRVRKTEFLDWLNTGVRKMGKKFSSLYKRMGCAGDLVLVNGESDTLTNLELQILVSYREGVELRPISAQANSGGEKMCCTMLFCFSLLLEEERVPPFVFVDELNQGLDYMNEEKIMNMMFEDAEKDIAPQSFVITPKLLSDLPFSRCIKCHIIFNGRVK